MIKYNLHVGMKFFTVIIAVFALFSQVGGTGQENTAKLNGEGCANMGNPAYAYCTQIMGYNYQIVTDVDGSQDGMCIMPGGDACPQWDFYAGKCGYAYSYCAQIGMQLETRDDGKDPFSMEYGVCVDQQGNDLGTDWSLSGVSMISEEKNDKFIETLRDFTADPGDLPQNRAVPTSFDWRNYAGVNWMTPVKNQANCGSCWAFSAVGLTEAQHNIMASDPSLDLDLAEQYLVSTCFTDGDCQGGREHYALQYIRDSGVPDDTCYPYIAQNSLCSARCSDYASRLKYVPNANWTFNYSELDIKTLLSSYGPVTFAIGVNPDDAGAYWDGDILRCTKDIPNGGTFYIDHAVLAVGYNDAGGYWIVKNSWGTGYKDEGYFKLGYNECNVADSRISWVETGLPGSNEAPTNIALSSTSVLEDQPINTVVGTITTSDPNTWNTHTYTLVSGDGSTDNAAFNILGNQLRTSQVFTKAIKDTYLIRLRTTDQGGLYYEKTFTITVTDPGTGSHIFLPLIINGAGSSPIKPLLNGGFDSGPDGSWTEYSFQGWDLILQANVLLVTPHGGQWAAWLGGDHNEISRLSQSVTITPAQPYLHFWYWTASEDDCGYDYARVKINGTAIKSLNLCTSNNTGGWTKSDVSLSPYAGSTVTLMFEVTTNSTRNSNFFLDDVSLSASATAAAPEPNQLASPPGLFQEKR